MSLRPGSPSSDAASSDTRFKASTARLVQPDALAQRDLALRPSGLWVPKAHLPLPGPQAHDANESAVHPAVQALLDEHLPGKSFKKVLLVHAHPDDETIYAKAIETMLRLGIEVHLVCITSSNGGTVFTSKTGVQRPTMAATGKEDLDAARFGELRVAQTVDFLSHLGPNPSLVKIDVLSYPDRSPFNTPAERSIRYEDIADWNSESIVEFLAGVLTNGEYAAAFGLRNEEAVHGAHKRSTVKLEEAISRFVERTGRPAPIQGAAVEVGYYDPRVLEPIDPERKVEVTLNDTEVMLRRALLKRSFGDAQPHREVEFGEQPPGNQAQWNAERNYEVIEVAPGTDPRAVKFLNALFNTRVSVEPGSPLPALLLGDEANRPRPDVRVHRADIPPHASSEARLAVGVPQPPATPQTAHVGPEDGALESLPARVRDARRGAGTQPFETSDHDAEGMAAFRAGPRFVSDHTPLKTRFGALTPKQRREGHRFASGPRRDTVRYAVSPSQMPHQTIGANGQDLRLDSSTRVFTTLESAKEYAIELLQSNPDADISMFRLVAPAKEMRAQIRRNVIPSELIERAAMVVDEHGNLYHETVANPSAKYRVEPGELYGPPPVTGMPVRYKRLAAVGSLGKITGTAVATYLSMRHGLGLSHVDTIEMMTKTGRTMFGVRAWINAQKAVMEIRLANLVDVVAAERGERLERKTPLQPTASPAGDEAAEPNTSPVTPSPALDRLQRRTGGVRGFLRGFTREDRAEMQLLADTLRALPEDVDAYQRLDELANSRMFSPNSVIERARRVLWGLSYGPSDIAGASIWLAPDVLLTDPVSSLHEAATWVGDLSTLAFVPVHLLGNGGSRLENTLRRIGAKRNLDPTVPADGEPLRDFQPGNDQQSALRKALQGQDLTHPLIRPDGGRAFRLPLDRRLTEFQMLGASVASAPFGVANALAAVGAAVSGDPISAVLLSGMVFSDATFARGFRHAYEDEYARNHGLGERVRRNGLTWLSPPSRGAEVEQSDITQPKLVAGGLLRRVNPQIVVAAGMVPQVLLNWVDTH
ncbi:PIG-L family deacetylase [Trinickia acidisoli]|uniref:PIG-L family deacetylase n=1 Tax=Trinickia acidisoli TaxID=2767482 RepID=UPI001A8E2CEE|nr:PIG-L family deacetylase [Trinickia acidisoli]